MDAATVKRKISLLLTALAVFAVPLAAYLKNAAEVRHRPAEFAWASDAASYSLYLLALMISGCLSLIALVLGVLAYRQQPFPRPKARLLELVIVGLPLLAAVLVLVVFGVLI